MQNKEVNTLQIGVNTQCPLPDYLTKVRTKMIYRLSNVEIIWPKLDVPYWYDKTAPNPFDPSKQALMCGWKKLINVENINVRF